MLRNYTKNLIYTIVYLIILRVVTCRIYADMVVNHVYIADVWKGTGSGSRHYDTGSLNDDPVFSEDDLNCCEAWDKGNCVDGKICYTSNCAMSDHNNVQEVRIGLTFYLSGLK